MSTEALSEWARALLSSEGTFDPGGGTFPLPVPRLVDGLRLDGIEWPGRRLAFVSFCPPFRHRAEWVRIATAHASLYVDARGQIWDVEDDAGIEDHDPALVARSVVTLLEQEAARWTASRYTEALEVLPADIAPRLARATSSTLHEQASDDLERWWHGPECSILESSTGLVPFLHRVVLFCPSAAWGRELAHRCLASETRGFSAS